MKAKLEALFSQAAATATGPLGVGFLDLRTGEEAWLNRDMAFPMASVYKTFVLCELMRRQAAGQLDLPGSKVTLLEKDKSSGSGVLELIGEGAVFSLMDYVNLMMAISDNTASDYLMKLAGSENIRKNILEPLGLTRTKCDLNCMELLTHYYSVSLEEYRRLMGEHRRFHLHRGSYFRCAEEKNNQTSPGDMVTLLSTLYRGRLNGPAADNATLDVMKNCQTNSRIPAKLPAGVPVAHKTGSLDHCANDAGIVYTGRGDYVLVMFYNGNLAEETEYETTSWSAVGTKLLAGLSRQVYDLYTAHHRED